MIRVQSLEAAKKGRGDNDDGDHDHCHIIHYISDIVYYILGGVGGDGGKAGVGDAGFWVQDV